MFFDLCYEYIMLPPLLLLCRIVLIHPPAVDRREPSDGLLANAQQYGTMGLTWRDDYDPTWSLRAPDDHRGHEYDVWMCLPRVRPNNSQCGQVYMD